jgi:NACHT domain
MRWSGNPRGKCIFWLSGMAGTGKSTISRTVAHTFAGQNRLGGSFFFTRGKGDLALTTKFFTSLARQLADTIPALKRSICEAILKNPEISGKYLRDQWQQLLFQPLNALESSSLQSPTLIFVVDALDECDESDDKIELILQLLAEAQNLKAVRLQVFITSRPETPIRLGFNHIHRVHQDVVLHEVPRSVINHDISVFVKHELENIRNEQALSADWPSGENIQLLIQRADGLFIYAATACRFIGDRDFDPIDQLDLVLKGHSAGESSTLDKMYAQILTHSFFRNYKGQQKRQLAEQFRRIVGSIIILFDSLSTSALAELLHVEKKMMNRRLGNLRSVLDVPDSQDTPIRLLHTSFRDFLLDKQRCREHIWVDEKETHGSLAESCLQLMSANLRKDICDLRAPGTYTKEVQVKRIEQCLPADLQYACLYWVQHFLRSKAQLDDNGQEHVFLLEHFLHWLEVLSLMGKTPEGVLAINALESMVIVSDI